MSEDVSVATVSYNLAGDEDQRALFLKSLIIGGIIERVDSLAQVITRAYLNGPAMDLRKYLRWVKKDPEANLYLGVTEGDLANAPIINRELVKAHVPLPPNTQVNNFTDVYIGPSNVTRWASQYMIENHPNNILEWTFSYNATTNEITINFLGMAPNETFVATGYVPDSDYLYSFFTSVEQSTDGHVPAFNPDESDFILWSNPWPDYSTWIEYSSQVTPISVELATRETTHVAYSDGRPDEETSTLGVIQVPEQQTDIIYYLDAYQGTHPDSTDRIYWNYANRTWNQNRTTYAPGAFNLDGPPEVIQEDIGGGVIKTTTITHETEALEQKRLFRESFTEAKLNVYRTNQIYFYRYGNGNSILDAMFGGNTPSKMGVFFPPIPLRYDNQAIASRELAAESWIIDTGTLIGTSHDIIILDRNIPPDITLSKLLNLVIEGKLKLIETEYVAPPTPGNTLHHIKTISSSQRYLLNVTLQSNSQVWFMIRERSSGNIQTLPRKLISWQTQDNRTPAVKNAYKVAQKALKKSLNANFDDLQEKLLISEDINDIDYAYAVFALSLNVENKSCLKYVYKFFQHLMVTSGAVSESTVLAWISDWQAAYNTDVLRQDWRDNGMVGPPPPPSNYPSNPNHELKLESIRTGISNYKTKIAWQFIYEVTGTGVLDPAHPVGSIWFKPLPKPLHHGPEYVIDSYFLRQSNQQFEICWQDSPNTWRKLVIFGLLHVNYIYENMEGIIRGIDAIVDTEESAFLVPLHESIYRSLSIVDQTQISTECCFLVLNCYEIHKKAFYEEDWFQILSIAGIIVVSVATALVTGGSSLGLGGAAIMGLLTAAGLSTTAALILAAAAGAVVGIVTSLLIQQAATSIFGEEWGPVAGILLTVIFSVGMSAGSVLEALQMFTEPGSWMALATSVATGMNQYLQTSARELAAKTAELLKELGEETARIQELYDELFGSGKVDLGLIHQFIDDLNETPEQFLTRKLLTGADIADITLKEIDNFVAQRLDLKYA